MKRSLLSLSATNFRSLAQVSIELSSLNVLVGPNGAGKSNLLQAIQFLGDVARYDLSPAINLHRGFDGLAFRGKRQGSSKQRIRLEIKANVTRYASENAPDEYALSFWEQKYASATLLRRYEEFQFKRTEGRGRRLTINGGTVELYERSKGAKRSANKEVDIASTSAALSTLRRLGERVSANQVEDLARLFETFRVFEPNVDMARQPSEVSETPLLRSDAANVAAFIFWLSREHVEIYELLVEDLRFICPSIREITFLPVGGSADAVSLKLRESGLSGRTDLADASFGTIRALSLLAMLHDPNPPKLTCVEEIDHGLHPHALDRIVDRLRDATRKTQILVATHSPALVNRLDPSELIVCERDQSTGASAIPAIAAEEVVEMSAESELRLGELWFSGVLGGGL
jgi:predicted ATPase